MEGSTLQQAAVIISTALNDPKAKTVVVDDAEYGIATFANGVREVVYDDIKIRTQNKDSHKVSLCARAAREKGAKIVWVMDGRNWLYLRDNKIISDWESDCREILGENDLINKMQQLADKPLIY